MSAHTQPDDRPGRSDPLPHVPLDPVIAAYHRRLKINILLACTLVGPIGFYGSYTAGRATAGHPVNLGPALALGVVGLMALVVLIGQIAVLFGEWRHPRTSPIPSAPAYLAAHAEMMLAQYSSLDFAQRTELDAAHTSLARDRFHHLAVDRVMLTAEWAGRLYHGDRETGINVLAAAAAEPAAYEAILAVLAGDACNPNDYLRLTAAWTSLGLQLPTDGIRRHAWEQTRAQRKPHHAAWTVQP